MVMQQPRVFPYNLVVCIHTFQECLTPVCAAVCSDAAGMACTHFSSVMQAAVWNACLLGACALDGSSWHLQGG